VHAYYAPTSNQILDAQTWLYGTMVFETVFVPEDRGFEFRQVLFIAML
jgi:hypothetical protein